MLPELSVRGQIQTFINACLLLIETKVITYKVYDFIKGGNNYLASKVINYLLEKSKLDDCKNFIESCKCCSNYSG